MLDDRFMHFRRSEGAAALAAQALELFAPVLPISQVVVARLPGLIKRYPTLQARDLIHVATCFEERIESIVSLDRAFDAVAERRRIDPIDPAALAAVGG